MKVQKSNSTSSKKNNKYQTVFHKVLMNNYYESKKEFSNNIMKNENFLKDNNNKNIKIIDGDSEVNDKKNSFKHLSDFKNNLNYKISNRNNKQNSNFKNSFSEKNKVIKIRNQKIKRQILSSENNISNNQVNFNKTSYPTKNWNNNYYKDEEPFSFNDKFISNSFIINQEDKTKKNKNNGFNETSSKLLSKDLPSSLNNTQRYNAAKFDNEEINNYNYNNKHSTSNYGEDYITFRGKEYINKDNNKTIEAEKTNKPKKIINQNFRKNNKIILTKEHNDINLNTYKNLNSKFLNNNIKSISNSFNSFENFNNIKGDKEIVSNENNKKIIVNVLKDKNKKNFKNLLFNNPIKDYKYKKYNNNIKNISQSTDGGWKNLDNIFLDKSKLPSEIESCIISFRNSKSYLNEDNSRLDNSQNLEFNKIKYIKKRILNNNNSNDKYLNGKYINDNIPYNESDFTPYKVYKKPNLALSQTIKRNINQDNDEYTPMAYSQFNIYNKTESNKIEDIFYKRQYLGNIFMRNKNKISSQKNTIFRKKSINSLIKSANNIGKNNISPSNSPIYTRKSPSILRKFIKGRLFEDDLENNPLINKNNGIYTKVSISSSFNTIKPPFKLFNSQSINIRNNIFNINNNLPEGENLNNTPFGEEVEINQNASKKEIIANNDIKSNNKNEYQKKVYSFDKNVLKSQKIIKKHILPISYYTKTYTTIFKMPILSECNFSKIYLLSFKNRKRKNYEQEIKTNNQEIKKTKLIHNKNSINRKKLLIDKNKLMQRNNDNKLEYDYKSLKVGKENTFKKDKNLLRIKVVRKKVKPKIFENMNNIQKIELNQTEIENSPYTNDSQSKISINQSEIINIPILLKSPKVSPKKEINKNINKNEFEIKKELSISNKKRKNNSSLRRRSSSQNKKIKKKNERNNILKIKMPNSEARKKKYKINIVKRVKVKFKKHFTNFSEEKILINNCNNDINEEQNIIKKHKSVKKNNKQKEKDNKIIIIIKEDLESFILFTLKNMENKNMTIKNYNFAIIEQLLIKQKVDLSNLIRFYLDICFDIIDSKDKIYICNDYINSIIEKYKRTYLNKNNFIQIHEDILEILIDLINESNKKNQSKYKFDITGALFYYLLINELFFVSDLNMFINCDEQIYINVAKIVRYIIVYSNDDKFKSQYFEIFKNSKMFFNNPIYFKYVTKYLKLLNSKYYVN